MIWTHNYLVLKRTLNHLAKLACFEQEFLWHWGNYRVSIYSETRTWHDNNMQSRFVRYSQINANVVLLKTKAGSFAMKRSWGKQSYALLRFINTVSNASDASKHFCQFVNKFKRTLSKECPFLNPHSFGENILLPTVSSCQ